MPARLHKFFALPWSDALVGIEAVLHLAWARFLIRFVPFARWKHLIEIDRTGISARAINTDEAESKARRIGRLVRMAARHVPFKAVCLPQAMAAQWMLSRRGMSSKIVIGADRKKEGAEATDRFDLHAWLISEEVIITGKREHARFSAFARQKADGAGEQPDASAG